MKGKKFLIILGILLLCILVAYNLYVFINKKNILKYTKNSIEELGYSLNDIENIDVQHFFINKILGYNEWKISVVFKKKNNITFWYSYRDNQIVFEGVSSELMLDKEDVMKYSQEFKTGRFLDIDNEKYAFKAKVLENNGNSNIWVKVLEDSELFKKNETVNVYVKNYKFLNINYTEDMYLVIYFDGNIEETYPPKITSSSIGVEMPPISIETKKDTIESNGLTIIIKNNSDSTYYYGPEYQIEKLENGKFVPFEPKEILNWNSVLYSIKASEEKEEIINLTYGYDKLENGIYRLARLFTSEENIASSANVSEKFYAEFEIK